MSRTIVKCSKCGWVHVVLSSEEIAELARTPEERARYRRCGALTCAADPAVFVPAEDGDVPAGATMPGCILEPAADGDTHSSTGAP